MNSDTTGNMYRTRKYIIRTLPHIDVIIGMNRAFFFRSQCRDDLVSVHIAAGSRPGLENINRKVLVNRSGDNLFSGFLNGIGPDIVELAKIGVNPGTGFFN